MKISINSEIGELEGVILHTPGNEIENMTPQNAERALYSDILNLQVASKEYEQFSGVLKKVTKTFEVKELLEKVLENPTIKHLLTDRIVGNDKLSDFRSVIADKSAKELCKLFIEGFPKRKDTLTNYLSDEYFLLNPLHNFFFTRDASSAFFDRVLINRMANQVRKREAVIMEAIFDNHPYFITKTLNPDNSRFFEENITMEGGDILVLRKDILLIGIGSRTSSQAVDYIAKKLESRESVKHIIVQQLPHSPESFIHLDMIFTLLNNDECMIFEPVIMKAAKYATLHLTIESGRIKSICEEENIIEALKKLKMPLKPILCGGKIPQNQEREQWHSGANFFAFAPGKIIGYARNNHTIEALNKNGYSVLKAKDVISGKEDVSKYKKAVVTIHGAELSRGGGGARCMTMPVRRKEVL